MIGSSSRLGIRFSLAILLMLVAAAPLFAANVTISGAVNFSALDGSADDADHTVNGVFTVTGDLVINGTISCNDDGGRESACPMVFNVGHDLIINAGGAIYAENRTGTGSGAPISFTVGHDFILHGPTTTLPGAIVSTDSSSSSGSTGGNITANVSGAVTIESGATIDSGASNAAAGAISIVAGGHIDASGNVLAGPSRTILSTRLTDAALAGGTGNQIGGAITLRSTSFVQPGVTVGSAANIVSQGQTTSAGPVLLEGCGVVVDGLVASLAYQNATSRVVIRSGKSIDVDGRDLGVTGATLGRNGKIRGDAPAGTALNHVIDLFALNDVNVLGPDPAASSLYAISGTPGVNTSKSDGATIRIISLSGGVTASGNVIIDGRSASGDDGGNVTVFSKSNINFDRAIIASAGDSNTSNPSRGGGTITVRSYSGNIVWTSGTGDVRPTGSASGLAASAQGAISLTACGTINLSGSSFPTNGPPVGVFPGQVTSACSPAAPSLPAGEPALPLCCNVITITNPSVTDGVVGSPFSQTFTQSGAIGTATFTLFSGTLPAGLTLSAGGVLSGTPSVVGSFPIVVQVTDSQGCTGVGTTYNLHIGCQTITVTNPAVTTTVAAAPFSAAFSQSGAIGGATFATSSPLPAGLALSGAGVLSGTPTQTGTFPIVVTVTDGNGCTGSSTYTLTVTCQTITVTNPATASGTVGAAFSQTFTQSGAIGTATFSTSSTLPAGLALSGAGVLSGTPSVVGTFPIVVTVTDANGCSGTGATYTLVIKCQTITVTNPANSTGTVGVAFSAAFSQGGGIGTTTFSTTSVLPVGLTLSSAGVLSGTPLQSGTFPIVVRATDSNGCFGDGATYTLVIVCNVITVTNPANASGTAGVAFSETFTQSGGNGTVTWSESGALPSGIALNASTGVLSGTTTQTGSFPIIVTVTDGNGCSGSSSYTLTIHCQTITVTNPAVSSGTAGTAFSATFTASGILGAATWSESGALPSGITLSAGTGILSGTTTQTGTFNITVTATDSNGCSGSSSYTLTINCQTIAVTNPSATTATAGVAFSATFTASGILGTATWSESGALPNGIALNASTGVLSGTPTQTGTFPITVTATDSNGCSANGGVYTLVVGCPTITVSRSGGGAFPAATIGSAYSQSVTASGSSGTPYTFAITGGALPTGLTLSASGAIGGTPSATGTFSFTVTATDTYGCSGSHSFSIAVRPLAAADSYSNLVNNTQAHVVGGLTATPSMPSVPLSGAITANDLPAGATVTTTGTFATSAGGSVTIASDGTFLYTPPLPATVTDTFTYSISSDTGGTGTPTTATGTVTLHLANRVWYVNPNAALNGIGQSQSPWNKTSAISGTLAGDIIFVYDNGGNTANTTAKITLGTSQQLIGQGVTLVVNGVTLVTGSAPQAPVLTASGDDVVAVGSGDTIAGVTLTNSSNALISGSSTAGLTVSSCTLTPGGNADGIALSGASGTIKVTNTPILGNGSGNLVDATLGSDTWTFTNSPLTQTTGRALHVTNKTGGGMTFDAASPITVSAGTADGAITLSNNSGGETFTFNGKLALTVSGTARAFVVSGSGTVNATDATSTISTADTATPCGGGNCSAAVDASGSALGMTFRSISVNGSHGNVPVGLSFNTTSGSFSVVGDGSGHANGSGGSITGATATSVYVLSGSGTYSFSSMSTTLAAASTNGWFVDNTVGGGTPTVNVTGCTFTGANSSTQTRALLQFQAAGSANVVANVQDSFFNNSGTYGFAANASGSSLMNVTVNQSGFGTDVNTGAAVNNPGTTIVTPNAIPMVVGNSDSAQVDYSITNNTFWGTDGFRGAIFAVTISGGFTTSGSHLSGVFNGNNVGKSGVAGSGCTNNCAALGLLPSSAGTFNATVQNNDFRQVSSLNVSMANTLSGSTATAIAHIKNNHFAEPDTATGGPFYRAISVTAGNSGGASLAACVEITGNTIVGPGWSNGSWIRVTNNNNTVAMTLPGLSPATGATATQVRSYLESLNTFTGGTGTDVNAVIGTAGINGGSPCP